MADSDVAGQTVIECGIGETLRICHDKHYGGVNAPGYLNGFKLKKSDLGTLRQDPADKRCVRYTHTQPGVQILEFVEDALWRRSKLQINGTMQIHDHSSLSEGGPAYATYFSELEEEEGEGT